MSLNPDDTAAILAALVQHLEQEDYNGRTLQEVRRDQVEIRTRIESIDARLEAHLDEVKPLLEATKTAKTLSTGTVMMWRGTRWIWRESKWMVGIVLLAWAMVHWDRDLVLRAIGMITGAIAK